MPLYINDAEVDQLAGRLAGLKNLTKTELIRRTLRAEMEREQAKPSLVELGLEFSRALRARGDATKASPMTKADIDALYEDN